MSHFTKVQTKITDLDCQLWAFWPEPPQPNIPHHLPPDVVRIYLQAERNFPIRGNELIVSELAFVESAQPAVICSDPNHSILTLPRRTISPTIAISFLMLSAICSGVPPPV